MAEMAEMFADLATDFTEHLNRARGHQAETPQASAMIVEPGEVLLIVLPGHTHWQDLALFQQFIDGQCQARGITLPVLVTVAQEVSTGPAPEGSELCPQASTGAHPSRRWLSATARRPRRLR
jgi:hypothetical protein